MSSLVSLDLSRNYDLRLETSSLKQVVTNLTHLREPFLNDVNMTFVSPNSFVNVPPSFQSLGLSSCGLIGKFPAERIFHLPKLQELDLSYNENLTGSFPHHDWNSSL